jgi:hypothetical protein
LRALYFDKVSLSAEKKTIISQKWIVADDSYGTYLMPNFLEFFPGKNMGISRDHWHKRRATGGKRCPIRKKRKFELARPAAMTKLGPQRIHTVRVRGGNKKFRALRLDQVPLDFQVISFRMYDSNQCREYFKIF